MRAYADPVKWTYLRDNANPETPVIKTEQATEGTILEHNKSLRNSSYTGDLTFGRHLAEIPQIIMEKWMKEDPVIKHGESHPDFFKCMMKKLKLHPELLVADNRSKYI